MSNTKKMTKKDYFAQIKAKYNLTEEEIKFIDHEIELLEKKSSTEKKPTAQQVANDAIKVAILDNMVEKKMYTITEIIKTVPECSDLTNQRVSALMRQLIDDKQIVRIEDKRKAYFMLAEGD